MQGSMYMYFSHELSVCQLTSGLMCAEGTGVFLAPICGNIVTCQLLMFHFLLYIFIVVTGGDKPEKCSVAGS
jgi:hypothetical protein